MNLFLCDLDKNTKITFEQRLFFVNPKLNNDSIVLSDIFTENTVDFYDVCSKAIHLCRFNPNFRNQTCSN